MSGRKATKWEVWCVALAVVLGCSSSRREGRPARLVSHSAQVDALLSRAERASNEGELERADALLRELIERHPSDPMVGVATLRRGRLALARNALGEAATRLAEVRAAQDEALDAQRNLLAGLLSANRGEAEAAVRALRPLDGRMIDRTQNVEVACGLLAMEARLANGESARALRAVAVIEQAREAGTRWLPTHLACDDANERASAFRALLGRVDDPRMLADTMDALPEGHSLRVDLARRLRTVAAARGETARWLRWLSDLQDDEATLLPVGGSEESETFRIGVLAPLAGPSANIGAEIVRAVQLAVRGVSGVEVAVAEEGSDRASAEAAFDHLINDFHCDAVIGPTEEERARWVSLRADALGHPVYLLAPYVDAVPSGGGQVRLAGPGARDRAAALAAAARHVGTRAVVSGPRGAAPGPFVVRLRAVLQTAGVTALTTAGEGTPRVVTGALSHEERTALATRAMRAPTRFILDARSGLPGTAGTWVGLRPGADFEEVHQRFCGLTGRAPGELALLAYDAAQSAIAASRGIEARRSLQVPWTLTSAVVRSTSGANELAVTRPCASTVLPTPTSGDPYAR